MNTPIAPIPVRPWTLNGLSERLIVSHYENDYGGAVRTLNAVRSELAGLGAGTPGHRLRSLKGEELAAAVGCWGASLRMRRCRDQRAQPSGYDGRV